MKGEMVTSGQQETKLFLHEHVGNLLPKGSTTPPGRKSPSSNTFLADKWKVDNMYRTVFSILGFYGYGWVWYKTIYVLCHSYAMVQNGMVGVS